MTDPIADMLTQLRNALRLHKEEVVLPLSKTKLAIAKILEHEGWVAKVFPEGALLHLTLRYEPDGASVIHMLRRVSKPGHRVYVGKQKLPVVQSHLGFAIVSTSAGMMTNREARKRGIGGEVICAIF